MRVEEGVDQDRRLRPQTMIAPAATMRPVDGSGTAATPPADGEAAAGGL